MTDPTGGQSRGSKPPRWLCPEAQDALSRCIPDAPPSWPQTTEQSVVRWYCREEAQPGPLGLGPRCPSSGYWREPSGATASTAGCQWAPEAWLPRSASCYLEPRRGLACTDQPGLGWNAAAPGLWPSRLSALFVYPRWDGPLPAPSLYAGSFSMREAMHRKRRCLGRVRMEI